MITNITHDTLVYDRMINEYYPEMIFSREDTIELRKRNVRKKQRNELYTFVYEKPLRASYNVIYPYQIDYVEIYPYEKFLLNKKKEKEPRTYIYQIVSDTLVLFNIQCLTMDEELDYCVEIEKGTEFLKLKKKK